MQISKDLSDWSVAGPYHVTITDLPGDIRQYKTNATFADTSRLFFRVSTVGPPFEPEP